MPVLFFASIITVLLFALLPDQSGGVGGTFYHALAFTVLGFLAQKSLRWPTFFGILGALAAFGGLIELLQLVMDTGRSAEMEDWLVDIAAAAVGQALGVFLTAPGAQMRPIRRRGTGYRL